MCPVQNCEYTLNIQTFNNFASPPFNPATGGIRGMVILPTSLLAPWLNPASIMSDQKPRCVLFSDSSSLMWYSQGQTEDDRFFLIAHQQC